MGFCKIYFAFILMSDVLKYLISMKVTITTLVLLCEILVILRNYLNRENIGKQTEIFTYLKL